MTNAIDTDRNILDLDGDGTDAVTTLLGNKLADSWTEGVSTFPTVGAAASVMRSRMGCSQC